MGPALFTGLVAQDQEANLIPGAAESWTISPDGKVYTFKLRKDDLWSDGTAVTASDVVFSWRRLVDPDTASEYASMAYPVLNAEEINSKKAKPEDMGVKAVDDLTLEVTLKGPTPYFLESLTHQAMYPVSKANVTKFGNDFVKPGNLMLSSERTRSWDAHRRWAAVALATRSLGRGDGVSVAGAPGAVPELEHRPPSPRRMVT